MYIVYSLGDTYFFSNKQNIKAAVTAYFFMMTELKLLYSDKAN
jgi:hypothetical protein